MNAAAQRPLRANTAALTTFYRDLAASAAPYRGRGGVSSFVTAKRTLLAATRRHLSPLPAHHLPFALCLPHCHTYCHFTCHLLLLLPASASPPLLPVPCTPLPPTPATCLHCHLLPAPSHLLPSFTVPTLHPAPPYDKDAPPPDTMPTPPRHFTTPMAARVTRTTPYRAPR